MQPSTFRYFHLKISAKRLPGRLRLDPLAIVYSGGTGSWTEIGRTEKRLNEWNPKFSKSIAIPADSDEQRNITLRVDFYHKELAPAKFLGMVEAPFFAIMSAAGRDVELELTQPDNASGSPRVFLAALEGYAAESGHVNLGLQLAQTNYYGVAMTIFYEISRAGVQDWFPVFKSDHIAIDEQGWGQFPASRLSVRDLTMDEEATGLLINIFRYKRFGPKRMLGHFQTSVKDLARMKTGDFIPFSGNGREDLLSADVQITHSQKAGTDYDVGLKLVNVIWKAPMLSDTAPM